MPAHVVLTVIVDGALETEETYTDDTLYREALRDAASHGYPTEVYAVQHDHERGVDCECVQYLADHHPLHTFNA